MKDRSISRSKLEHRLVSDPTLREIARSLNGLACFVVGGWVRDRARGFDPEDLDLVVEGVEEAGEAAAIIGRLWGGRPHFLGSEGRAVWRVTGTRGTVEIWPLETSPEDDAHRRDFTCNAVFWRLPEGPVLDCVGGLEDIERRRIRAVSEKNLIDDPVRLLRSVRFLGALEGFSLESGTRSAVARLAPRLISAPRERVGAELFKMAHGPRAARVFREAFDLGLLEPSAPRKTGRSFSVSPEVSNLLAPGSKHPVPSSTANNRPAAFLAWLCLGWEIGGSRGMSAFSWPRDLVRTVFTAVRLHRDARITVGRDPGDRRLFIARCGLDFPVVFALAAAAAAVDGDDPRGWRRWWRQWRRSGSRILDPPRFLETNEIVTLTGIDPGPGLGKAVAALECEVLRGRIRSPAGARRWLERQTDLRRPAPGDPPVSPDEETPGKIDEGLDCEWGRIRP